MNIKIGSVFNLNMDIIHQKDIHRFRFKIMPFVIRELKIGDLLYLTSGITYIKILSEPIPEITPKIDVDIRKISLSELLSSELNNLSKFFPYAKEKELTTRKDNMECFVATKDRELVSFSTIRYARGGRLMISESSTLERFRGNHINSAVFVYIMRYLRDVRKADRVYSSSSGTNISMKKSILRAGSKIDIIFYDISLLKGRIKPIQFLRNLRNI